MPLSTCPPKYLSLLRKLARILAPMEPLTDPSPESETARERIKCILKLNKYIYLYEKKLKILLGPHPDLDLPVDDDITDDESDDNPEDDPDDGSDDDLDDDPDNSSDDTLDDALDDALDDDLDDDPTPSSPLPSVGPSRKRKRLISRGRSDEDGIGSSPSLHARLSRKRRRLASHNDSADDNQSPHSVSPPVSRASSSEHSRGKYMRRKYAYIHFSNSIFVRAAQIQVKLQRMASHSP